MQDTHCTNPGTIPIHCTPGYQSGSYCEGYSRAAQTLFSMAKSNGIAVFVSSGNEAKRSGISFSSCMRDTIAIGAVYDGRIGAARFPNCMDRSANTDQVTCYSNSARILDILAPSHAAYTPSWPRGKYEPYFGGTSAACPYAAGAAALIQSYHKEKTGHFLSVDKLRQILIDNGDPVRDSKSGITKPRVNIARAIQSLGLREDGGTGDDRRDSNDNGDDDSGGMPIDELRDILRDAME